MLPQAECIKRPRLTAQSTSRRRIAQRREGWRRVQSRREIANEGFHRGMPESVEAEEIHFFHGLFRGPLFESHAIGSDENASAIVTKAAVNENFLPRFAAKQRQELNHLLVSRRRPAADGDVHKAHSKRLGMLAFPGDFFLVFTAKIDN